MDELHIMRAVNYDSRKLTNSKITYSFFNDEDEDLVLSKRTKNEGEKNLCEWIFSPNADPSYLIYDELDISRSYRPYYSVSKPLILRGDDVPGDIDILLIDHNNAQISIAFQVKVVKGTVGADGVTTFNKINKLEHGIGQSRAMYKKLRFHLNYLMIIIVSDGHKMISKGKMFRSPDRNDVSRIYRHPGYGDLPEKVGLFFYEITQPSGKHINFNGTLASKVIINAKPIDQLSDTTLKIKQYLKEKHEDKLVI